MARKLPRAEFVQLSPDGRTLYAIYPAGVSTDDVQTVANQLQAVRGVQARAVRGSLDDLASPQVAIVEVVIGAAADQG